MTTTNASLSTKNTVLDQDVDSTGYGMVLPMQANAENLQNGQPQTKSNKSKKKRGKLFGRLRKLQRKASHCNLNENTTSLATSSSRSPSNSVHGGKITGITSFDEADEYNSLLLQYHHQSQIQQKQQEKQYHNQNGTNTDADADSDSDAANVNDTVDTSITHHQLRSQADYSSYHLTNLKSNPPSSLHNHGPIVLSAPSSSSLRSLSSPPSTSEADYYYGRQMQTQAQHETHMNISTTQPTAAHCEIVNSLHSKWQKTTGADHSKLLQYLLLQKVTQNQDYVSKDNKKEDEEDGTSPKGNYVPTAQTSQFSLNAKMKKRKRKQANNGKNPNNSRNYLSIPSWACLHNPALVESIVVVEFFLEGKDDTNKTGTIPSTKTHTEHLLFPSSRLLDAVSSTGPTNISQPTSVSTGCVDTSSPNSKTTSLPPLPSSSSPSNMWHDLLLSRDGYRGKKAQPYAVRLFEGDNPRHLTNVLSYKPIGEELDEEVNDFETNNSTLTSNSSIQDKLFSLVLSQKAMRREGYPYLVTIENNPNNLNVKYKIDNKILRSLQGSKHYHDLKNAAIFQQDNVCNEKISSGTVTPPTMTINLLQLVQNFHIDAAIGSDPDITIYPSTSHDSNSKKGAQGNTVNKNTNLTNNSTSDSESQNSLQKIQCNQPIQSDNKRDNDNNKNVENNEDDNLLHYITPYVSTILQRKDITPNDPNPRIFAIDCEMVRTHNGPELARITLLQYTPTSGNSDRHNSECSVVASNHQKHNHKTRDDYIVLLDVLVKPRNIVLDYLTYYSGITPNMLRNVKTRLEDVQAFVLSHVCVDDVLIGHSLENDLRATKVVHSCVIDTAVLFRGRTRKYSLKHLAGVLLQRQIQVNGISSHTNGHRREGLSTLGIPHQDGHCSEEDASTALHLAIERARKGPSYGIKETNSSNSRHTILEGLTKLRRRDRGLKNNIKANSSNLFHTRANGPMVGIGPSPWIEQHVSSKRTAAHALVCPDISSSSVNALVSYVRHGQRRASIIYARLHIHTPCNYVDNGSHHNNSISKLKKSIDHVISNLLEELPSTTATLLIFQGGYPRAKSLYEKRKTLQNSKSTLGLWLWDSKMEDEFEESLDMARECEALWIGPISN
eukprot:CAMPEP_0184871818 /NCGR_PEP_ID=MMETSP0580-20130426/40937_1 /TAXON_ID=1118495 /ORGANISM="Dactyliosolen fragilissimus" /LENGTH=1116 /DNA_ID=CAMNT_0027374529 /DNA_START=106 /DNA_END=3456 /DNA_ORIENTATION=+